MTGAAIPEGADAVCKYEDTDFTDTTVTLKREYSSGENVIRAGEDIKKGSICACKGTAIDAGISGILSGGAEKTACRPKRRSRLIPSRILSPSILLKASSRMMSRIVLFLPFTFMRQICEKEAKRAR